jgi:RNA polymerase sigma factor (TIGR02999 family)
MNDPLDLTTVPGPGATDPLLADELTTRELIPVIYQELRRYAQSWFRDMKAGDTWQPTALVHEACAKLMRHPDRAWNDEGHFRAVATRAMRQMLIDHAREKRAQRRHNPNTRVTLHELRSMEHDAAVDYLEFDDALTRLESIHARQGRIAELRFIGGLSVAETSRLLDVSERTVELDTRVARAWLIRELMGRDTGER